jgi:hypothetical protein
MGFVTSSHVHDAYNTRFVFVKQMQRTNGKQIAGNGSHITCYVAPHMRGSVRNHNTSYTRSKFLIRWCGMLVCGRTSTQLLALATHSMRTEQIMTLLSYGSAMIQNGDYGCM